MLSQIENRSSFDFSHPKFFSSILIFTLYYYSQLLLSIIDYVLQIGNLGAIVYSPATQLLQTCPNICQMPVLDNCHGVNHMFSYLSTPRSLYDCHMNTSSLAIACGDKPAHCCSCYDHVRVVACTVSRTDNPWTYLPHPQNTSFLTIPFTFLPSAKK